MKDKTMYCAEATSYHVFTVMYERKYSLLLNGVLHCKFEEILLQYSIFIFDKNTLK